MREWITAMRIKGWSIRSIARAAGMTVGEIHALFGCSQKRNCTGQGCNV